MATKKRSKDKEVSEEVRSDEEEERHFLSEDDEEEETVEEEYYLDANAEEKVEEALAILGAPAIIHSESSPSQEMYPTPTHLKYGIKYTEGDVVPPFSETLILRK